MASGVVSKNLYEILGNDPELDPERKQPEPPVKTVDKPAARHGKRDGPTEPPVRDSAPARGGRGGGRGGREQGGSSDLAFRDRGAGSYQNRQRPTDEFRSDRQSNRPQDGEQRQGAGRGRGRGQGRGGRGGRDDRHSRTGVTDSDKQAGHGWGENTGEGELADETTGEAIAQADAKQAATEGADGPAEPVTADDVAEAEPEDKTKSYDAYLAEQKEKRAALGGGLEIRKPNEGNSKKLPEGKAVEREEEQAYFAGAAQKAKRERARKERNVLELDNERLHQAPQESFRGGRGGRGGRGRGDHEGGRGNREGGRGDREGGRGDRGDREGGRGRGDGSFRGEGRGRGGRGGRGGERGGSEFRGGRGGGGGRGANAPNTSDAKQFPSLGA